MAALQAEQRHELQWQGGAAKSSPSHELCHPLLNGLKAGVKLNSTGELQSPLSKRALYLQFGDCHSLHIRQWEGVFNHIVADHRYIGSGSN
jgi:hypothetical protein